MQLVASLSKDENYFFLTVYSSFVHISFYLTQTHSLTGYHALIGSFLFYIGVVCFLADYLNVKLLRLRKLFFYLLVLVPIAIVVFSILSKFKVLRILQESFTIVFEAITAIYSDCVWFMRRKA